MPILDWARKFSFRAAGLLFVAALTIVIPGGKSQPGSAFGQPHVAVIGIGDAFSPWAGTQCTFSDGSTITFGRKAAVAGAPKSGEEVWRAGDYEATAFVASETMRTGGIPGDPEIPAGGYTIFIDRTKGPSWTLIISKKTGTWGMPYPGKQYDLERISMGYDVLSPPAETFTIGCVEHHQSPMFLWAESGTHVAYAKIMAEKITDGKTALVWR